MSLRFVFIAALLSAILSMPAHGQNLHYQLSGPTVMTEIGPAPDPLEYHCLYGFEGDGPDYCSPNNLLYIDPAGCNVLYPGFVWIDAPVDADGRGCLPDTCCESYSTWLLDCVSLCAPQAGYCIPTSDPQYCCSRPGAGPKAVVGEPLFFRVEAWLEGEPPVELPAARTPNGNSNPKSRAYLCQNVRHRKACGDPDHLAQLFECIAYLIQLSNVPAAVPTWCHGHHQVGIFGHPEEGKIYLAEQHAALQEHPRSKRLTERP